MGTSFRVNIVYAQIVLLAKPTISSTKALIMGTKQIIVVWRSAKTLEWARKNGATHILPFNEKTKSVIQEITGTPGADWFLDAAGHQAVFEACLSSLNTGGRAAM